MNILEIIEKKRTKKSLTENEIQYFINEYCINKTIPDYQASALLMAININGMDDDETYWLTKSMLNSGQIINFNLKNVIDKHSTGGVGDKITPILSPLCAAKGINVAKMSGKGLGHTGGTIDKLNSIGVKTDLSIDQCNKIIKKNHVFVSSQTNKIAPADKILYDLRNATSTVNSLPLIASSIMSKKLSINSKYIFIDVKIGDGGFCENLPKAEQLSKILIKLGKKFNRKVVVHITNMTQPLGKAIGNAIEMNEVISFLNNQFDSKELKDLIYEFVADIFVTLKISKTKKDAYKEINNLIKSKRALNCFYQWIVSQGAIKSNVINKKYWNPKYKVEIKAKKSGYIKYISAKEVGLVSFELGAGRVNKNDSVDYQAGIWLNKTYNDKLNVNDTIATLYSSKKINNQIIKKFEDNILISNKKFPPQKVIVKVMK